MSCSFQPSSSFRNRRELRIRLICLLQPELELPTRSVEDARNADGPRQQLTCLVLLMRMLQPYLCRMCASEFQRNGIALLIAIEPTKANYTIPLLFNLDYSVRNALL